MRAALSMLLLACGAACAPEVSTSVPSPDPVEFDSQVYPVLLRDCGFPACHGERSRFLFVAGPGRTRLSADSRPFDPATAEEKELTYERARAMLAIRGTAKLDDTMFLAKPLSKAAGGAGHEGEDVWGFDVYNSRTDPGYLVLQSWAASARGTGEP